MIGYGLAAALGAAAFGAAWFGVLAVKKIGAPLLARLRAWWGKGEARLAAIETDVKALKTKVGL